MDNLLDRAIASLDISPTDFEVARSRYMAVAKWLEEGNYVSGNETDIYLQGSFRIGTVIRPYRNSQNADYDIDQVCEVIGTDTTARILKNDIGDRLKDNGDYRRMLDDEGRRCWTLIYASSEERPGFHLDVLPSQPRNAVSTNIGITHKVDINYSWRSSNPKGFYQWFKQKNSFSTQLFESQRTSIFDRSRHLYKSVEEVPIQLIRTPLQRSIQLMKRHRDVFFDGRDFVPISIILTTICAHNYRGHGILDTLTTFVDYVANRLGTVVRGHILPIDNILDYQNGKWIIKNPADENENFADRWESTPELAENFFAWVYSLRRDIRAFKESVNTKDLDLATTSLGAEATCGEKLLASLNSGPIENSTPFLDLIHQGIDGKVDWNSVLTVASRNVDNETEGSEGKDIAWVNYYQTRIHSGSGIDSADKQHIRSILASRNSPAFTYCCNLLLGSATAHMLQECMKSYDSNDVLDWPINKLAKGQIQENSRVIIPSR